MESKPAKTPLPYIVTRFQKSIPRLYTGILFALSSFPLAVLLYYGRFARYVADDYSTAGVLKEYGFWQTQVFWYQTWTGSYSYTFFTALLESVGVAVVPWLVVFTLGTWLILTFGFLKTFFQVNYGENLPIWWGILALMAVFGTIRSFQNYDQLLYWETGIVAYLSNVIIFLFIIIYFIKRFYLSPERTISSLELVTTFLVFMLTGGVGETWVVMQAALFTLGLFLLWVRWLPLRNGLVKILLSGFFASWVSFLITFKAPGNVGHAPTVGALSLASIWNSLIVSFTDIPRFLFEWGEKHTMLSLTLFVSGFLAGLFKVNKPTKETSIKHLRAGILIFGCTFLILWSGFFPGYAVFHVRPPDRALFTAMFIFILGYIIFAVVISDFFRAFAGSRCYQVVSVGLCIVLGFCVYKLQYRSALGLMGSFASLPQYAQLWDKRDALIQQSKLQGKDQITVCSFKRLPTLKGLRSTIWLSGDLTEDTNNWINAAAANYYKMKSITASNNKCHE